MCIFSVDRAGFKLPSPIPISEGSGAARPHLLRVACSPGRFAPWSSCCVGVRLLPSVLRRAGRLAGCEFPRQPARELATRGRKLGGWAARRVMRTAKAGIIAPSAIRVPTSSMGVSAAREPAVCQGRLFCLGLKKRCDCPEFAGPHSAGPDSARNCPGGHWRPDSNPSRCHITIWPPPRMAHAAQASGLPEFQIP